MHIIKIIIMINNLAEKTQNSYAVSVYHALRWRDKSNSFKT